jgi:hypothetical protein
VARRLLLFGVLALALSGAAGAGAAGRATSGRCTASQLKVTVRTQGVATAASIGLTVRNPGPPCTLRGSAVFTIERAGRVAAVKGNPLRIPIGGPIGRGYARLVKAGWSNWCHSRRDLRAAVRYLGVTRRTTFSALPACIDRTRPSRLQPID